MLLGGERIYIEPCRLLAEAGGTRVPSREDPLFSARTPYKVTHHLPLLLGLPSGLLDKVGRVTAQPGECHLPGTHIQLQVTAAAAFHPWPEVNVKNAQNETNNSARR